MWGSAIAEGKGENELSDKQTPIRWIDAGQVGAYCSQALYHGLAHAHAPDSPDTIVWVQPSEPYVCVGHHQRAEEEVNLKYCLDRGLPVIQRETGGGMVYIDNDQVFVQWVFAPSRLPMRVDRRFAVFVQTLAAALEPFGLQAALHPPNDLQLEGRKLSGTGAAAIGTAEVITGNFLLDFDYQAMEKVLASPHPTFSSMFAAALAEGLTTLRQVLGDRPSLDALARHYREACQQVLGRPLVTGSLTPEERAWVARMEEQFARQQQQWRHRMRQSPPRGVRVVKVQAQVWVATAPMQGADGTPFWLTIATRGRRIEQAVVEGRSAALSSARAEALGKVLRLVDMDEEAVREVAEAWWELHGVSHSALQPAMLAEAVRRMRRAAVQAPFAAS